MSENAIGCRSSDDENLPTDEFLCLYQDVPEYREREDGWRTEKKNLKAMVAHIEDQYKSVVDAVSDIGFVDLPSKYFSAEGQNKDDLLIIEEVELRKEIATLKGQIAALTPARDQQLQNETNIMLYDKLLEDYRGAFKLKLDLQWTNGDVMNVQLKFLFDNALSEKPIYLTVNVATQEIIDFDVSRCLDHKASNDLENFIQQNKNNYLLFFITELKNRLMATVVPTFVNC